MIPVDIEWIEVEVEIRESRGREIHEKGKVVTCESVYEGCLGLRHYVYRPVHVVVSSFLVDLPVNIRARHSASKR